MIYDDKQLDFWVPICRQTQMASLQVNTNWIGNWDLPPADTKHFWLLRLAKRVLMSSYQTSHWKHLPSFTRPPDTSQYTWGPASRARDQGVVAKNLVHSNADQTSHWICILRTCHRNRHSCHVWNRLKQHHNLSPGAKTLCSAHHKQNPSELKVDSSPLNHQRTRDFQPQKNSRDFLILCFFRSENIPFSPDRGSTQKVLNLPGSKIGTLSAVDQDTTTVGGACPSLVRQWLVESRKMVEICVPKGLNWSFDILKSCGKPW